MHGNRAEPFDDTRVDALMAPQNAVEAQFRQNWLHVVTSQNELLGSRWKHDAAYM